MDGGPATIHDLQQEVLEKIFKKLEEPDLANVQNVCSWWSEIVNKRVGRRVCVGDPTRFWLGLDQYTKVGLEELSQIGIHSCVIYKTPDLIREDEIEEELESEAEDEEEDTEDEDEENADGVNQDSESGEESEDEDDFDDSDDDFFELPDKDQDDWESPLAGELKYPYLLKELELHGSVPPDVFARLVRNARNLSILKTTIYTLANLRNENLESLVLPNLKELIVDEYSYNYRNDFLPNLQTLLTKSQFPRLTCLHIDLPPGCFLDLRTTRNLIFFVQDHYALQEFWLNMYYYDFDEGKVDPPGPDPATHHELRTIIDGIRRRGECHLRSLNIHSMIQQLHPFHQSQVPAPIEIINEFLLTVTSLKYLGLTLPSIQSNTLQTICTRNSSTLWKVDIGSVNSTVDCSVFASLTDVQSIWITAPDGLDGINQLPACLRDIKLMGPIGDANYILLELPNMESIRLYGRGTGRGTSGVTLDMLKRFVGNRKVESLCIGGDSLINLEFPPEGIPNNDPTNPKMLHLGPNKYVLWELNEDGFYEER